MRKHLYSRISAAVLSIAFGISAFSSLPAADFSNDTLTVYAADTLDFSGFPQEYKYAADWIWNNRIVKEQSTARYNTLFDQIVAGNGTINYVVRWQSYKTVTYEQRKQFETLVSDSINGWAKWLVGYENWPYDHIDVNIVGWAVIDKNCLLDLHDDEVVYTETEYYDSQYDTSNGYETIPDKLPLAPSELSRFDHFADQSYQYPGGLDKRFDMYLWATQGFPSIGGCGGDWGQRLSDDAYLNMLNGDGIHVLEHELGHGFGMTDFYGGEGESDGFPPGGFPGGENSLMMAGSAAKITDFDGWMLRYMWSQIKDEEGRFDLTNVPIEPTVSENFTDTITGIGEGYVTFAEHGTYTYDKTHYGNDETKNLSHYEVGDKISISLTKQGHHVITVNNLTLIENSHVSQRIMGDVNADGQFNVSDVVLLQKWLLTVPDTHLADWKAGDLCEDDRLDVFDLCLMKRALVSKEPDPPIGSDEFISAPINDVKAFLPSQGDANLVIFYIDFPDCKYDYAPSEEEIYEIAFGAEDKNDANYPFDSMSAFFKRSSKGAMNLKGKVFRYTTNNNQTYYNENKFLITQECYEAFKDSEDFSQFDGNGDGYIDTTLLTVPAKAGDDHWWPCAGPVDQDQYYVDGKRVGHIITGNAQINSLTDYSNFNSTYLHEMGHCMGIPDYYLFTNPSDSEGMHGMAGIELMDTDASTDFGAVSKLQLGWYTDQQIQIYDGSQSSVTYTLNNAQGEQSNCVLIPYNDLNNYHSEYMILEYTTPTGNNSQPSWWVKAGEGVRVYHAETSLYDHGTWVGYKYGSGSEFTDSDKGRRYLRIIDDVEGDNLYHSGDTIDSNILGFNWYDANGQQTIDTGIVIEVGEMNGDTCNVTIRQK